MIVLVETMQEKVNKNRQVPQNIDTSPLGLRQRNPLHISDREIRDVADRAAFEEAVRDRLETYEWFKHQKGWLDHQGYYTLDSFGGKIPDGIVSLGCQDYFEGNFKNDKWNDRCGGFHFESLKSSFQCSLELARSYDLFESYTEADALQKELASQPDTEEEIQKLAERVLDFMNHVEIRHNIWTDFSMREQHLQRACEESGAVGDFKRSEILCRMSESGLAVPKTRQISYHANAFFEYNFRRQVEGKITPARKDSIRDRLQYYLNWTNLRSVDKIASKAHIDAFRNYVWNNVFVANTKEEGKISDSRGRDVLQAFFQFVRWLADEQIIKEFPPFVNGRKDKKYTIKVAERKVKKISIRDVRLYVEHASPRMKLYLLLILNCGFGQGEIGRLQKDEYDSKKGRIVHKRCKEGDHDEVPTVTYLLWDETKALLDQAIEEQKKFPQREEYADYLLLNTNGRPLWREKSEDSTQYGKVDNIKCRFRRLRDKLKEEGIVTEYYHFYQIRKLPPSLIKSRGKQFGTDYRLWLGHAAAGVAERHYVADDEITLDPCIEWLHEQIFGESALKDGLVDEIQEKSIDD